MLAKLQGKRILHTLLMGMFWKGVWRLLTKLNIDLPYDPAIPLIGIYTKECDSGYSRGTCTPCLLRHYSQQPSYGSSQDAPPLTNGLRKCGILLSHKIE
jgi:hypothetical protein